MIPAIDTCDLCEGTGKFGCTNYCENSTTEREICRREHGCTLCKGTGKLSASTADWAFDNRPVVHLLGLCEHEFEDTSVEHDEDEVPVSMNPFTDVITYRVTRIEAADQMCTKCGLTQVEVRACECEDDEESRCRCSGPCHC